MINYPLNDMLKVRKIRETAALSKLAQANNVYENKVQKVSEKKEALNNYRIWRLKKQSSLLEEIEKKTLDYSELEYITTKIQWIKMGEKVFVNEVDDAEKELEKAEEDLKREKSKYAKTQKEKLKLDTHKELWVKEQKKEAERKSEEILEDCYAGGKNGYSSQNRIF